MNTAVSPESGTIPEKKNILEKNILSLRLDQAIGLVLVLMVFYVVVFSMGFEKGKRSIHNSQVLKSSAPVAPVSEPLPRNLLLYEDTALPSAGEKALVATVPQQIPIPAVVSDKSSNQESDTESSRPAGKYTIQHVIYTTRSAAEREVLRLTQKASVPLSFQAANISRNVWPVLRPQKSRSVSETATTQRSSLRMRMSAICLPEVLSSVFEFR